MMWLWILWAFFAWLVYHLAGKLFDSAQDDQGE